MKNNCKECAVLESLDNAWRAIVEQYHNSPNDDLRCACNILAKVIEKVQSDFQKAQKENEPHQISIEEWLKFFDV